MSHTVTFPNIKVEVRLTIRFREDEWERWAEGWTDEEQWSLKIRQRKTLRHLIARINKRASRQVHDTGYTWTAEGLLDRDGDAFDLAEQVWAVKDFAMPFIVVTSERVPVPVLSLDSILTERQLAMSSCDCMVSFVRNDCGHARTANIVLTLQLPGGAGPAASKKP